MDAESPELEADPERLRSWLVDALDVPISSLAVRRLDGGNSSGAWRLDIDLDQGEPRAFVLKAPEEAGIVHEADAAREGRILGAANRAGAPVPAVVAVDGSGEVLGRPAFVMELIEGTGVPEDTPAGLHGDGWFRDASAVVQRATWFSFVDALAALHGIDGSMIGDASRGPGGPADVLRYWRRSLLDAVPAELAPKQVAILDWLIAHVPDDGDHGPPALCMGDARLGNALLDGTEVVGLVDFEVSHLGHPAGDVGYLLMHDRFTRLLTDRPAAHIPTADETWDRWEHATGRTASRRTYWTAYGATVLAVTGTRAMLRWGFPVETVEADNLVVGEWEALIERAAC